VQPAMLVGLTPSYSNRHCCLAFPRPAPPCHPPRCNLFAPRPGFPCPQPNSRLLINYGIVDEDNPYDKLPLSSEQGSGLLGDSRPGRVPDWSGPCCCSQRTAESALATLPMPYTHQHHCHLSCRCTACSHHPQQRPAVPPEARQAGRPRPQHPAGAGWLASCCCLPALCCGVSLAACSLLAICTPAAIIRPLTLAILLPALPRSAMPTQTFQLQRGTPLPPQLLPYLRLVHATQDGDVVAVDFGEGAGPVASENELIVLNQVRVGWHLRVCVSASHVLSCAVAACVTYCLIVGVDASPPRWLAGLT
jgi:hypothetical protein